MNHTWNSPSNVFNSIKHSTCYKLKSVKFIYFVCMLVTPPIILPAIFVTPPVIFPAIFVTPPVIFPAILNIPEPILAKTFAPSASPSSWGYFFLYFTFKKQVKNSPFSWIIKEMKYPVTINFFIFYCRRLFFFGLLFFVLFFWYLKSRTILLIGT